MKPIYEFNPHTADIGIRVKGKTLAGLFQNAGFALFDIMADIKKIKPITREKIEITADDTEELMNFWLSLLLKQYTINNHLLCSFKIKSITGTKLTAVVKGEEYNQSKHSIMKEIKAVTFHGLSVKKIDDAVPAGRQGWQAEIIFDV
jgi:SHS2 domain-containing protein